MLLVDDDPDILESLRSVIELAVEGVHVETAASGPAGLAVLRRDPAAVDLIVSDFRMPGMDGAEFLEQARALAPNASRVLISAFPEVQQRMAGRGGIDRVLAKPMDLDAFIGLTRELLR